MGPEVSTNALARLMSASRETLMLRISREGRVLHASAALKRLLSASALESLDYVLNLAADERAALLYTQGTWHGTASLVFNDRPVVEVHLTAVPDDDAILVLLEVGLEAMLSLQDEMGQINSRLTNLTRERTKQAAKLNQAHTALQTQHEELQALTEELEAQNDELQALNEELEAQTEELIRSQSSNAELTQVNAELHRLDTLKNQFIGIISHELKTPLNFITGYGSILEDEVLGPLNEKQQHAIARLMEGAERLEGLIKELLDANKVQAGKLTVSPEPVDYAQLLAGIYQDLKPSITGKQLSFSLPETVPPRVQADPQRLHQVLRNLLSNAIKFTPEGGAIVLTIVETSDGMVETTVRDTGIGIPAEALSKVFEPFYQVDSSSTRAFGGTGLGLAIVRSLVEAMGGTIRVDSTPAEGSAFRFTLPALESPVRVKAR